MDNQFGANLRLLRKKEKLTLENLGKILGISKSAVADYEVGKTFPPLDICQKISDFFEITIDDFRVKDFSNCEVADLKKSSSTESSQVLKEVYIHEFETNLQQLEFQNKLLNQQVEGLQIQLQLVKQIVSSKDAEIKSLQIQVRLLEEKISQNSIEKIP